MNTFSKVLLSQQKKISKCWQLVTVLHSETFHSKFWFDLWTLFRDNSTRVALPQNDNGDQYFLSIVISVRWRRRQSPSPSPHRPCQHGSRSCPSLRIIILVVKAYTVKLKDARAQISVPASCCLDSLDLDHNSTKICLQLLHLCRHQTSLQIYKCSHCGDYYYAVNTMCIVCRMDAILTIKDSFRRGRSILNLDIGSKSLCCCGWGCCCPPEVCCWGAGTCCCIWAAILTSIHKSRIYFYARNVF